MFVIFRRTTNIVFIVYGISEISKTGRNDPIIRIRHGSFRIGEFLVENFGLRSKDIGSDVRHFPGPLLYYNNTVGGPFVRIFFAAHSVGARNTTIRLRIFRAIRPRQGPKSENARRPHSSRSTHTYGFARGLLFPTGVTVPVFTRRGASRTGK